MKKISLMFATLLAVLGFASCSETWEDNPRLTTHEGEPVEQILNTPELANSSVIITEQNNKSTFNLVCSQPKQYGYAASVGYQVEISLNEDFKTPVVAGAPASIMLPTIFRKCDAVAPTFRQVAEAMCKMLDVKDKNSIPTESMPLYVRLRANIYNESGDVVPGTAFMSNTVKFEKVSVGYLAIIVPGQPTGIYVRGGMNGWGTDPAYEFKTTTEADVYVLDYVDIPAGVEFKIADKEWGAVNFGVGSEAIVTGKKIALDYNAGNISFASGFKGSITIWVKGKTLSVLFDAAESDTPGVASGIYLRGGMNDWGADAAYEFKTTDVKNVWEVESVTIADGTVFKVADANWGDINLGGAAEDGVVPAITAGAKYSLEKGGGNIKMDGNFTGKATLQLRAGKYTLTLKAN